VTSVVSSKNGPTFSSGPSQLTDRAFGKTQRGRAPPSTRIIAGGSGGADALGSTAGGAGPDVADDDVAPLPLDPQASSAAAKAHAAELRVPAGIMSRSMPESAPMTRTLASLTLIVAAGCGGVVVLEDDGGGAGGDDGSVTVSSGTTPASSGSSGSGSSDVIPNITDVKLGGSCMPVVGPDPVAGSVVVSYENAGSTPGSAELFNASIYVSTSTEGWVFPLEMSPTSSGVIAPSGGATVEHVKVSTPGDSSFLCSLCGMEATLVMNWEQNDQTDVADSKAFIVGCAF